MADLNVSKILMNMKNIVRLGLVITLASGCVLRADEHAAGKVEKVGQESKIAFEHAVSGHLTELNGRYKLRVTETTYMPGGHIGEHHHSGPGIRLVLSGELTYIQADKTTIYKAGDYIYESGDVTHTAVNKTNGPVKLLNFEILPVDWQGASPIPVPHQ